jgi:hypothetical protein
MSIVKHVFNLINLKRISQIELMKKHPVAFQEETFLKLINTAKKTEFGKQHHFDKITSFYDFQHFVPIRNYEQFIPYINRILKGEKNLLWPEPIKWFAKSSGTTSKSKFIPVSNSALKDCHFKGGKDIFIFYANQVLDTKVFDGKSLSIGGSHQINEINNKSFYGDLSAVLIQNMPFWAEFFRTPTLKTALMNNWLVKLDKIIQETYNENIVSIAGVPSWTLVLLQKLMETKQVDTVLELWPNLELFIHGGISFGPYRNRFNQIIPANTMHYLETYNASEGFFAIQNDLSKSDLLLMLDYGIFYEFVPINELNNEYPKTLTIGEVEKSTNYALVISTNSGLWRYLIGDTVQFTSLYPHKIKITGRTKYYLNVFGEEIMIHNTDEAIAKACEITQASVNDYTVAPIFMTNTTKGRHQWLIEFSVLPQDIMEFTTILDNVLQECNSDYEAKRKNDTVLMQPVVTIAPPFLFQRWLERHDKLGGQHKIPRLSNERTILEELLSMI